MFRHIKQVQAQGLSKLIGLSLFLGLLHTHSLSASFELEPDMPVITPEKDTLYLEETNAEQNVASILSGKWDADFHPLAPGQTSVGITKEPWWVRFEANNDTDEPIEWVMHFPFSITDEVDFYCVVDGKEVSSYQLGDKRPLDNRPLTGEGFAIPITTPAGKTTVVYVRMLNRLGDGLELYSEVSSPQAYYKKQLSVWIFYGIIVGGILALFLYNAVIYAVVRDTNYLWYLLYLCCALMTILSISGIVSLFPSSHEGIVTEALPPIFSSLTFIFVLQFSRSFLETKTRTPRIDWALRGLMVFFVIPPLLFFLGYAGLTAHIIMVGCIGLSILPIVSGYIWHRGHRAALIFTFGWGIWFLSIGTMAARFLILVPSNDFSLRIGWIGILCEAVLFSLALAYNIRHLLEDKAAAEERERAALQRSKEELEALVRERTRELANRNEELHISNGEKDKFFSIIAHDLRNPFNGVIGLAEALSMGIHEMSREEVDQCLMHLHRSTTSLHKLMENLLSWALLQRGGLTFNPQPVDFDNLFEQCMTVYQQAAHQKKISIQRTGQENLIVYADAQMLATVIRNLLSNAIKYSHEGDTVTVNTVQNATETVITVSDNGVGIAPQMLNKLFILSEKTSSPGTQQESGTGLGLELCKELVETHGGTLSVESQLNTGTTFTVRLKTTAKT